MYIGEFDRCGMIKAALIRRLLYSVFGIESFQTLKALLLCFHSASFLFFPGSTFN